MYCAGEEIQGNYQNYAYYAKRQINLENTVVFKKYIVIYLEKESNKNIIICLNEHNILKGNILTLIQKYENFY